MLYIVSESKDRTGVILGRQTGSGYLIMKSKHTKDRYISDILKMVISLLVGYAIFFLVINFSSAAYQICKEPWIHGRLLAMVMQLSSLIFCLYLYTQYVLKSSFSDLYIRRGKRENIWYLIALIVPAGICSFYLIFVPGSLKIGDYRLDEMIAMLISGILLSGVTTAITEELIFRGLMLKSVETLLGKRIAILISSLLFAVYHLVNIDVSDSRKVMLVLTGTMLAGLALGLVTIHMESIWPSVMIHAMYNILGGDSALINISNDQLFPALFSYTLKTDRWMLAGIPGTDDMETALPAMVGFAIIIFLAQYRILKEKEEHERNNIDY